MEIIETINKRLSNGRYVYVANSKEKPANKADIKVYSNEGNAILFSSIYFNDSETKISAEGLLQLAKAVEYLAGNPDSKAILAAHAGLGKADKKHLSEKRTKAVVEYLIAKGIAPKRIKETGKGSTKIYEIVPESADETKKNKVDVYIKDK
jgi:outer membrane protein OmpA-like peptidoglycan-associated protein